MRRLLASHRGLLSGVLLGTIAMLSDPASALGASGGAFISSGGIVVTDLTCTNQVFTAFVAPNFTCTPLTLTSAQFANQGTTTTVLHGNAVGNSSFGAVVSADLNLTATTCVNQLIRSLSSTAAGTCATVQNADLASSSITIQGVAVSLGGTTLATTADVQFGTFAVGTGRASRTAIDLSPTFSPITGAASRVIDSNPTVNAAVSADVYGFNSRAVFNKAASGTHALFASVLLDAPTIGAGGATVTTAATLKISGAPGGATNNYSFWNAATTGARMDHVAANGAVATAMSSVGPTGSNTTIQEWLIVITPTATRYIPMF